jgi:hypothetical protein
MTTETPQASIQKRPRVPHKPPAPKPAVEAQKPAPIQAQPPAPKPAADRPAAHQAEHRAEHQPERLAEHAKPQEKRVRMFRGDNVQIDEFGVNFDAIPSDVSVEWKRFSNVGAEDPFYLARMEQQGWRAVDPREHPDWLSLPPGYDKSVIIKSGLLLMERPKELTEQAIAEREARASRQVKEAEQRLGKRGADNEAERLAPRLEKHIGRMVDMPPE